MSNTNKNNNKNVKSATAVKPENIPGNIPVTTYTFIDIYGGSGAHTVTKYDNGKFYTDLEYEQTPLKYFFV